MGAGRPTDYCEDFPEKAYKLCLLGATEVQMADFFGVVVQTLHNWKGEYPLFLDAITRGKLQADSEVAEKLFHRAKGYSHKAEKIFNNQGEVIRAEYTEHYPPDTQAASLWLRNRQPKLWRDKTETEHSGVIGVTDLTDDELQRRILELSGEPAR